MFAVGGCAPGPRPDAEIESRISHAAGAEADIQFSFVGENVDEGASVRTLELAEAVRLSLAHDPQLQAALARLHVAYADAEQSRLLPNPVLAVTVRFPEGGGSAAIEAGLAADLIAILQQPRRVSAADARLWAASSEVLATALDGLADVQERYASVQALDAQAAVLRERERLVQRLLDLTESRVEAGESPRLDALTLNTERVQAEVDRIEREAELRDQRLALARRIGQPSGEAEWDVSPWEPPPLDVSADESTWIAAAMEHRPEVQARVWELAALGDEVALARFALWEGAEVGVDAERDDDWSVGPSIAMPLPLFDWGQARRKRIEAQRAEARHLLVQARRAVVEDVRRALASMSAAKRSMAKVHDELIPLLEQRREQAESAYTAGVTDITAVLLAEQEMHEARSKLIDLQHAVSAAHFRLQRAVGGPGVAVNLPSPTTHPTTQPEESINDQ